MRLIASFCFILVALVIVNICDGRKTFSSRRKSGGSNQRTSTRQKPASTQQSSSSTPHRTDSSLSNSFLNHERAGSSHSQPQPQPNTHYRGSPFDSKPSAPEAPKHTVPNKNGPIGFENVGNQGKQNIGFDKVNSEVQQKHASSHVPSAPAYPVANPPYPGGSSAVKPPASAPNGPPPVYPGYNAPNTGSHAGGYEPPPAYPGRPVNAPPVYSPNNPNFNQRSPAQAGYPTQQAGYQQSGYPQQQGGLHQSGYPTQQGSYPGQSYPTQQNFGYPNTGGNYPNQGYNQGFGSYPSGGYNGGFGQSSPSYGGNSYGGSPFGHSNPYGGSPFGSGFGGNSFGGSGYHAPNYNPNSFGYSNNPGLFGSQSPYPGYSGKYSNFGYHKKSRFGGLPIPIPIPIPIPLGGFGGFGGFGGGHSYNHRLLNTFAKNQNATSNNETTNVFILNNSTVTPCTTDQFIYDSLNITLMSCTAGNCTAIKMFVTTYMANESNAYSAGLTMCLEPNATYSTFAENVNPVVSDVHRYWMRVCKEFLPVHENSTANATDPEAANATVKIVETIINETVITAETDSNATTEQPAFSTTTTTQPTVESTTSESVSDNNSSLSTFSSTEVNTTSSNSTANSTLCEIFNCHWIEMCLPGVELVDRCSTPGCAFTKTSYQPCVRLKMCKSPSTPISTFATLNTTISRIDQDNITTVNDIANLTLISYIPPIMPTNCSDDASDTSCRPSLTHLPINTQEGCVPQNATEGAAAGTPINGTSCIPPGVNMFEANSTNLGATSTEVSTSTPVVSK